LPRLGDSLGDCLGDVLGDGFCSCDGRGDLGPMLWFFNLQKKGGNFGLFILKILLAYKKSDHIGFLNKHNFFRQKIGKSRLNITLALVESI
jgi:hypothetical protein